MLLHQLRTLQKKQISTVVDVPVSKIETTAVASSSSSSPSILIQSSAAECEEEEKSTGLNQNSKSGIEAPITAKNLKIGMNVTAKLHQIRARGLVIELAGGIRGMLRFEERMATAQKIGHVAYHGPSIVKEIIYGLTLGLMAGGLWKLHHWNNKRRTKEFYDLLEKGVITTVVEDAE